MLNLHNLSKILIIYLLLLIASDFGRFITENELFQEVEDNFSKKYFIVLVTLLMSC